MLILTALGWSTVYYSQRDTAKTCIQNWKLDVLISDHVRYKSLQKDTQTLNKTIVIYQGVIADKDSYRQKDSLLMIVKDSTSNFWQKAYTIETKSHGKTKNKLENHKVVNYILGASTLLLLLVAVLSN